MVTIHKKSRIIDAIHVKDEGLLRWELKQHVNEFAHDLAEHVALAEVSRENGDLEVSSEIVTIPKKDFDGVMEFLESLRGTKTEWYAFQVYHLLCGPKPVKDVGGSDTLG